MFLFHVGHVKHVHMKTDRSRKLSQSVLYATLLVIGIHYLNSSIHFVFFYEPKILNSISQQYNDTLVTLTSVRNTLGDQFTDTATTTLKVCVGLTFVTKHMTNVNRKPSHFQPITTTQAAIIDSNATTTTVKPEKYRISRQELGYILGKNYRGLRKLLRLELNDAANVSIDFQSPPDPAEHLVCSAIRHYVNRPIE